jgi:signal transduction histidine kinase
MLTPPLLAGCSREDAAAEPIERAVKIERVRGTSADAAPLLGTVRQRDRTDLSFESRGRIARIDVDVGDPIRRGQILATLDMAPARLRLRQAEANVQGVRWLLLEALSNLANNALAHTPAGGIVTVRCGTAGGSGYLEVTDNGVGIPVAEREEMLGRFYRGSNARGPGSRLGLAIVAEVAQLHGAAVSIGAGPDGQGTVLRISFPQALFQAATSADLS